MVTDEALAKVIAAVLDLDPGSVDETTSADTVEAWDSVRHMNLVLAVEETFGITLPDEEVVELTSFALLRAAIRERLGAG